MYCCRLEDKQFGGWVGFLYLPVIFSQECAHLVVVYYSPFHNISYSNIFNIHINVNKSIHITETEEVSCFSKRIFDTESQRVDGV